MKQAAAVIAELPERRINVIDVGCWTGAVTRDFVAMLPGKEIFSIGIDPVYHAPVYKFTHFEQVAISNCDPGEGTLYEYTDPMCNSLLKMTSNITHDKAERKNKWYGATKFEGMTGSKTVPIWPLSAIVKQYGLATEVIHFLKIDAQGCDLEAFLSLGRFMRNCLFVQMETVLSGTKEIVLYEGQTLYEEELPVMGNSGFQPFEMTDHRLEGASPEGDIVYVNAELLMREKAA